MTPPFWAFWIALQTLVLTSAAGSSGSYLSVVDVGENEKDRLNEEYGACDVPHSRAMALKW